MSKLSPSLNSRLANIDITQNQNTPAKSPRSPKKSYPASLYPRNYHASSVTTPSKAPVLSTARRAQSRSVSTSKNLNESGMDVSPERKVSKHTSATNDIEKSSRKSSGQDHQFSFMRETTSSRKKQHAAKSPIPQPQHQSPQDRAVSHPELYNKRPCTHLSSTKYSIPVRRAEPKNAETKSSKAPSLKIPSPHKLSHSASSNDVYSHLYDDHIKVENTPHKVLTRSTGLKSLSSALRQETPCQSPSSRPPKVSSLSEMYSILHNTDPSLFDNPHTSDPTLEAKSPILSHQLQSHPEGQSVSVYERGEIMRKQEVYYLAKNSVKNINVHAFNSGDYKNNFGFDDKNGNYLISLGDHIEYRYEMKRILGTGSFGNVVLCVDHKYSNPEKQRKVAIKIIRNDLNWSLQAVSEIKMLKQLSQASKDLMNDHIMTYYDHFHFRGHMCIATEVLSVNLFTFLELMSFRGLNLQLLKRFAIDILKGLSFVHDQKVIHCDVKPENIMIKLPSDYDPQGDKMLPGFIVKLIDFGSSCYENDTSFSYIQSRFYRAPEVILGSKYSSKIDIWSLGCVLAEIYTGTPLLPGKSEIEQIALVLELFGAPPAAFIINEKKKLMKSLQVNPSKIPDPVLGEPSTGGADLGAAIDEKKIKRTLLYSLFTTEGKINLQFLNQSLLASGKEGTNGNMKKSVKPNSRSLSVSLRLHNSGEAEAAQFSRFLTRMFGWNPVDRPTATALLSDPFLN